MCRLLYQRLVQTQHVSSFWRDPYAGVLDISAVTTTYAYDDLGRTSSVTNSNSGTGGITSSVSYTYDAAGNKKTQTTASGTMTCDYDADERLVSVHAASVEDETQGTVIASYGYDDAGNRKGLSRANGVGTVYTCDSLNRLTGIANTKGGAVVSSFQYVLGPSGKACPCRCRVVHFLSKIDCTYAEKHS